MTDVAWKGRAVPFKIEQVSVGDRRLRDFVAVPWQLRRGDPCWTPPLRADFLGNRLFGITGLLTAKHPYHKDAEATHFVARDGRKLLGRVSAAVNRRFNEHYGATIGSFGFFEVAPDYEVCKALLDQAGDWLRERWSG